MSLKIKEIRSILILVLLLKFANYSTQFHTFSLYPYSFSADQPFKHGAQRLTKPLIRDDGRVYACSGRTLFSFERNGTVAWSVGLDYTCSANIAPVHGGSGEILLVADNRVLKINSLNVTKSAIEVFFDPDGPGEILGLAVSISSSLVFFNVKKRGLFAYRLRGPLLWSADPVLYQHGYRQGCRKNITGCFFSSVPVIDHCEASIYISNNEGELYSLSMRTIHFRWIQDFSSFDKAFIITAGNNGRLYITIPVKTLVLALDASRGNILWQGSIGPLSTADYEPVVDSNGWISIGSLDGFLYSFSPTGVLNRFPKWPQADSVIQVNPVLDCSGYALYVSRTKLEGKSNLRIGEYTYFSAMKPKSVVFEMIIPASGTIYWSENYLGQFSSNLSASDLQHFVLDEGILLAFIAASRNGNPYSCRTTSQKLTSSCTQIKSKNISIYAGDEKAIVLFLLLETTILVLLAVAVRFCYIFWKKKKLQNQVLGEFLEKRRSLQLQKKALSRTITELKEKTRTEIVANKVLETLSNMVKEKEGIERKLSTSYSFVGDAAGSGLKSLLPLQDRSSRSYSFHGAAKEGVSLSDTSDDSSTGEDMYELKQSAAKVKAKAPMEVRSSTDEFHDQTESSSDKETPERQDMATPSSLASSGGCLNPLTTEYLLLDESEKPKMEEIGEKSSILSGRRSIRRRASSFSKY